MSVKVDNLIIGAGIYGLYAAKLLAGKKESFLIVEKDEQAFSRASYINQARVHNGYHYPRSLATAAASAHYYRRFCQEFDFAINRSFKKIYAIARKYSFTEPDQFEKFCEVAGIPCTPVSERPYFNPGVVAAAFETEEVAFDAHKIRSALMAQVEQAPQGQVRFGTTITAVERQGNNYRIHLSNGQEVVSPRVINCTYASNNQVLLQFGLEPFQLKYEICEITRCRLEAPFDKVGITVMDGPFFSVMPFGQAGDFTLTAVAFTPHWTSYEVLPTFQCQGQNPVCTPSQLENCNHCPARPKTAWPFMLQLARKYLKNEIQISFKEALFAIKPIPQSSEIDDSRPTIIKQAASAPDFISVLSGKINTVYDLEALLC